MSRFLLVTWDGGGAFAPEFGIARRLMDRGHEVSVLADPTLRQQVRAAGAEFEAWQAVPHRVRGDASEDIVKDWEVSNPLSGLRRLRDRLVAGPAAAMADETAAQVASFAPDVVLADYFMFGAMIAGQAAGLPVGALMPNIWALPVRGVPPLAGGLALARGPLGRARDAVLVAVVNRIFARGLGPLNDARSAHGLPPLSSFYDQVLGVDRILVLTSPTFDYAAPFVPPNARYVGPALDEPGWAEPSPRPADDDRPLVLASLSSTFQDQAALLQRILDALSTLPVRGVLTTGPAIDPSGLRAPANVELLRSAAHGPILERASAVITHCGHGTTLKALAAGVPLVCLPMGRDQDDTAARVVHHGAGIRLRPTASAEAIAEATREVLRADAFRAGARRLASAISAENTQDVAVREVEAMVAREARDGA